MIGWNEGEVEGDSTTFEHIDFKLTSIRDYIKFLKIGYGRNTHFASIKIGEGKITREEALMEAEKDGEEPINLNKLLEIMSLAKEKFFEVISKHKNIDSFKISSGLIVKKIMKKYTKDFNI